MVNNLSSEITKRKTDEEFDDYFVRLFENKNTYDLNCEQIAELLNFENGENFGESAYRKRFVEFNKGRIYERSKNLSDSLILNEIALKTQELQKERYKIQNTKIELNRTLRQDSRFELFYENIKDSIISLEPPKLNDICNNMPSNKEYILGCGDFHYGANFTSENNVYSREICKQRFEILLRELKNKIIDNKISKLKIASVADTIQGILRMTDLQMNDIPVVDCVVEISRLLAIFLNNLSSYCEIEYYHCSCSNHSQIRPLGSKASEIATEDMERIIVNYISDLLANNNRIIVKSDLSKEYLTFDIFDFKAIILHGHQVKSVPNVIKDLSNLHREFYDFAFLGHRHSANEIIVGEGKNHNIEVLTCPSFVGSDPYADKLRVGSKAMCKLYEFDTVYGHVGSYNIILN